MSFLSFIKSSFEGKERLWKVFWILGFGGKILLFLIAVALSYLLTDLIGNYSVSIGIVAVFSFKIYWGYSVWMCSDNATGKLWKYSALTYTVFSVFFGLAGITSHDFRVLKNPKPLFDSSRDMKVFF